jgi:hypothetical protein
VEHFSKVALFIPRLANEAGRIARIWRWLANDAINTRELYDPLIRFGVGGIASRW